MSSGDDGRAIDHLTNDLKISEGHKHPHRSQDVKVAPVKVDDRRGRTNRVAYEGSGGGALRRRMGANGGSDGLVLGFEHSSTCSGRHHRQGRNSRRDQSLREMMPIVRGRVKSLKDKGFGFLECCDRAGDMFFHQTESNENLCVGDEVEFRVEDARNNNKKPRAIQLHLLPAGSISFYEPVEGLWEGIVKREPQYQSSSMGYRTRGRGHGGWGEESAMGWIEDVEAVVPFEPPAAATAAAQKANGDKSSSAHVSDSLPPVSVPVAGEQVFIPTECDDGPLWLHEKHENGVVTEMTSKSQTVCTDDRVRFSVSRHKRTNALYARRIHLVRSAREVKLDNMKKDGNHAKENGIVIKLSSEYGFLRSTTRKKDVYFSIRDVMQKNMAEDRNETKWRSGQGRSTECHGSSNEEIIGNSMDGGIVQSSGSPLDHAAAGTINGGGVKNRSDHIVSPPSDGGDSGVASTPPLQLKECAEAEFWVIMEDNNPKALEIELLPPGSVTLKEIVCKGVMGVVHRSPIRQKNKWKPGSAIFHQTQAQPMDDSNVAIDDTNRNPISSSSDKRKETDSIIHASLAGRTPVTNWGSTADQMVKFFPGDCIVSDLMVDHRDKKFSVVNVQVLSMAGPRIDGIVSLVKLDDGIGFIRESQAKEEVFFQLSDVVGGKQVASRLSVMSEVRFNLLDSKGGGNPQTDRPRAVRLEVLPSHTLLSLEGKDINGTVAFEARVPNGDPTTGSILMNADDIRIEKPEEEAEIDEEEVTALSDCIRTQINAIEDASPGTSVLLPAGLTADQDAAVLRSVAEKKRLGYTRTREGGNSEEQLRLWKLPHQATNHEPVTQRRRRLEVLELKAKENAKQLASVLASEHGLSTKGAEAGHSILVDFRAPYVLGKDWACKGDDVLFDLVYNCPSRHYCAINIRIIRRAAQTTERWGYIESLSMEKNENGCIILPDTCQRISYTVENLRQQQQPSSSTQTKIKQEEVMVMQDGGWGVVASSGGGRMVMSPTVSEDVISSSAETDDNTGMVHHENKDLQEQDQQISKIMKLSVHAPAWEPPLSVDADVAFELAQDEMGRMIAINVRRTERGSIPRVPLNKLPDKRKQEGGGGKSETLRQHGVIVIPPRKFLMEEPSSGDKEGEEIQTEASVALVRMEKGNKISCLSPIRLLPFILEEMGPGEGLEGLARGDILSFLLTRGKDGRQVLSKAHLRQRNAIPRIRGTVDCLKPERNPTHATILTLDSTIPKAHVPLVDVVGMMPLKEGDKVEFLATSAAPLPLHKQLDNVLSTTRSRTTGTEVSHSHQRIGAEAAAVAVDPNDRCPLSGLAAGPNHMYYKQQKEESTMTHHRDRRTYVGLMLVKDLEDTGVQKREGSRKSRNASTAARIILAKGPDGTKGFLPGWCSRYPSPDVQA